MSAVRVMILWRKQYLQHYCTCEFGDLSSCCNLWCSDKAGTDKKGDRDQKHLKIYNAIILSIHFFPSWKRFRHSFYRPVSLAPAALVGWVHSELLCKEQLHKSFKKSRNLKTDKPNRKVSLRGEFLFCTRQKAEVSVQEHNNYHCGNVRLVIFDIHAHLIQNL